MQSTIPNASFNEKLRELFQRNLDCVTGTDHLHAGVYRKTGGDHFVVAACLTEVPVLLLYISDKILTHHSSEIPWNWECKRTSIASGIIRLNRISAFGTHELYEFPECAIYSFKQCVLMLSEPSDSIFCELIDRGIREFDAGLVSLRG